jgi:hypothetical protein
MIVGLALWWISTRGTDAGPLALPDPGSSRAGAPVLPGQWLVTSVITGELNGDAPAVIDSVEQADASQSTGLVLRYAALPDEHVGLPGAIRGWPPEKYPLAPLRGYVVQPGHALHLAVGGASTTVGTYRVDAFTVRYHVGNEAFVATFKQGLEVRSTTHCQVCREPGQLAGRIAPGS